MDKSSRGLEFESELTKRKLRAHQCLTSLAVEKDQTDMSENFKQNPKTTSKFPSPSSKSFFATIASYSGKVSITVLRLILLIQPLLLLKRWIGSEESKRDMKEMANRELKKYTASSYIYSLLL